MATKEELLREEQELLERKKALLEKKRPPISEALQNYRSPLAPVTEPFFQGLSFGFIDEMGSAGRAALVAPFSERTFGEVYRDTMAEQRGSLERSREEHPVISTGSEVAGAVFQGGGLATALSHAAPKMPVLARLATVGGVEGALYGAGTAEEGERLGGALTHGAIGAVAGPVAYGVTNVAGKALKMAARPIFRAMTNTPTRQAERIIGQAIAADDLHPALVKTELQRLGPNATIADLGENLSATARGVTAKSGNARTIASNLLNNRQAGQQSRLVSASGLTTDVGDFKEAFTQVMTQRQSQAAPLYEQAYATPLQITDNLKSLMERPTVKRSLARAFNIIKDEGLGSVEQNHVRVMDAVKQDLDDQIGASLRNGERNAARRLLGIKGQLLAEIDAQVPAYRQARELFSNEAALRDAGNLGRSLLTTRVDMDAAEIAVEAMTEGERHTFRLGAIRGLVDKLDATPESRNAAGKLVESVRARELLKMAFPDPATLERFIKTAEAESQFSFTRNRVLGGSPTARIQEEVRALNEGAGVWSAIAQGKDAAGMAVELLKKMGLGDVSEETLNEVAKILFSRNVPERQIARMAPGAGVRLIPPAARQGAAAAGGAVLATDYFND